MTIVKVHDNCFSGFLVPFLPLLLLPKGIDYKVATWQEKPTFPYSFN